MARKKYPPVRGYRVPEDLYERLHEWRRTEQSKQGAPMSESAAVFELLERGLAAPTRAVDMVDLTGKMLGVIVRPFMQSCSFGSTTYTPEENQVEAFRDHALSTVPVEEGSRYVTLGGESVGLRVLERRRCHTCQGEVWVIEHVGLRPMGEIRDSLLSDK